MEQASLDLALPPDEDAIEIRVPAIKVRQPIGDIFFASFTRQIITRVTFFDVRRRLQEQRDIERYLGIQRPLDDRRVEQLSKYVRFLDATFPTAIIIALNSEYASFDEEARELTLRNFDDNESRTPTTNVRKLARVIDGQHRVAGLMTLDEGVFDVPVTVFIGSDIADQAYVFSTVNLEQSKVNRSLAYDLFELAHSRSPQKTCHNIAVALDRDEKGPLYHRIKRLGLADRDRSLETIAQATFVDGLLRYISLEPKIDRDLILKGRPLERAKGKVSEALIFRNMFVDSKDLEIARVVANYFEAVAERWPDSWQFRGSGQMLNRTNGFNALMRALRYFYLKLAIPGDVPTKAAFLSELSKVPLHDGIFTVENFVPGSSGEGRFFRILTHQEFF